MHSDWGGVSSDVLGFLHHGLWRGYGMVSYLTQPMDHVVTLVRLQHSSHNDDQVYRRSEAATPI